MVIFIVLIDVLIDVIPQTILDIAGFKAFTTTDKNNTKNQDFLFYNTRKSAKQND